jgi:hypothetical protein
MKTTLLVLSLVCATAAFGQSVAGGAALSSQPQVLQLPSHPEHASQKPLAQAQDVLESSGFLIAQGERPLWEVAPPSSAKPLGDTARLLKQAHARVKKASIVWEN